MTTIHKAQFILIGTLVILSAILVWQNSTTPQTTLNTTTPETKTTYLGGLIPKDWSELDRGDMNVKEEELPNSQTNSTFAIGKKVRLGDTSELISFYLLTKTNYENLLSSMEAEYGNSIKTEEVDLDGIELTMIKYPVAGKEGGGVDYLMPIPTKYKLHESHPDFLLIRKESTGSAEFEMVFAKYIDSIDFAQLQEISWNNYTR